MSSARKVRANRANARASTGPKTKQGRALAAQNARRHGLSLSVFADPARSAEVELLAREIAGEHALPNAVELARHVAEAQIDLMRIHRARHNLLVCYYSEYTRNFATAMEKITACVEGMVDFELQISSEVADMLQHTIEDSKKIVVIISDRTQQLITIDRYERRALSRRKFAIRELDVGRQ